MNRSIIKRPLSYSFYNVTLILIAINVLVFFLTYVAQRSVYIYLTMNPMLVVNRGYIWQFVTYMFVHGGISHILFNMLGLFFFGSLLERRLGSNEFLMFYLVSGVLAGLFSFFVYWFSGSVQVFLLGASGAVYAVLLAYATYFPDSRIYIMGILPVRAPILVLGFTAIALFSQVFSVNAGVAHLTHLAGFGVAFIYLVARLSINPFRVFFGHGRFR